MAKWIRKAWRTGLCGGWIASAVRLRKRRIRQNDYPEKPGGTLKRCGVAGYSSISSAFCGGVGDGRRKTMDLENAAAKMMPMPAPVLPSRVTTQPRLATGIRTSYVLR